MLLVPKKAPPPLPPPTLSKTTATTWRRTTLTPAAPNIYQLFFESNPRGVPDPPFEAAAAVIAEDVDGVDDETNAKNTIRIRCRHANDFYNFISFGFYVRAYFQLSKIRFARIGGSVTS